MASGECHACGEEYARLRQHWSMSDCSPDPEQSAKVTLECDECGESFGRWRYRVDDGPHYCSHDCKDAASREGEYRECATCGDELYVPPSHLSESSDGYSIDRHFCDKECEAAYRKENWVGENHPSWQGGKVTLECEVCGGEFAVTPARTDTARFCSRACLAEWHAEQGEDDGPPVVEVKCERCGDVYEQRRKDRDKTERSLCSPECVGEWLSEVRQGTNNPAWKGGKVGINAVRRGLGSKSWNHYAEETREQAGYACELCGDPQPHRRLSAHHIIPVAAGGTNNQGLLMALCEVCHKKAESFIGQYTESHLLKFAD